MDLIVNGKPLKVPKTIDTIIKLIKYLELKSPVIIAEHNDVILKSGEHGERSVQDGDKVEFVQFIGGG